MNKLSATSESANAVSGVTLKQRAQMVLATLGRTTAEINRAFRRLAKRHHPDARGGDQLKFKVINEAYQLLTEGRISKTPLLANDELVLQIAGRCAAPLLDQQKIWETYKRWHEQHFHAGDWFYPSETSGKEFRKMKKTRGYARHENADYI